MLLKARDEILKKVSTSIRATNGSYKWDSKKNS